MSFYFRSRVCIHDLLLILIVSRRGHYDKKEEEFKTRFKTSCGLYVSYLSLYLSMPELPSGKEKVISTELLKWTREKENEKKEKKRKVSWKTRTVRRNEGSPFRKRNQIGELVEASYFFFLFEGKKTSGLTQFGEKKERDTEEKGASNKQTSISSPASPTTSRRRQAILVC